MSGSGLPGGRERPSPEYSVAVVTVTTNDARWLGECFRTLTASAVPSGARLDLILVDNASSDGSAELVGARFPAVHVIRSAVNEGFAGANNRGIEAALSRGCDYVFLVNPDTRTPPDLVGQLAAFMMAWPEYGIIGPLQYAYTEDGGSNGDLNEWSRSALANGERHVFTLDWEDHPSPAGPLEGRAPGTLEHAYVQGSALMCRAEIFRQIGVFDPAYHTYYEETDLCRRARWAGWRVALVLGLGIQHVGGGGTTASAYRRRHMLRNKYYFLITDPEWGWRSIIGLCLRWVARDLTGRGAVPAPARRAAVADTVAGLSWLLGMIPRMAARRRQHRILIRTRQCGPIVAAHRQGATRE